MNNPHFMSFLLSSIITIPFLPFLGFILMHLSLIPFLWSILKYLIYYFFHQFLSKQIPRKTFLQIHKKKLFDVKLHRNFLPCISVWIGPWAIYWSSPKGLSVRQFSKSRCIDRYIFCVICNSFFCWRKWKEIFNFIFVFLISRTNF